MGEAPTATSLTEHIRVRATVGVASSGTVPAATYARVASSDVDDTDDESLFHAPLAADASATILSSSVNITNTILGSGMLAMPKALASTGLALGSLMILLAASISAFGLTLLTLCASKIGRQSSFFQITKLTYPQAAIYFDLAVAVKCFGVSISYLVIIGDLMPTIMRSIYLPPSINSIHGDEYLVFSKTFWISVAIVLLIPVAFAKTLNSLRHTSALALCSVVYLVAIVCGFFVFGMDGTIEGLPPRPSWEDVVWIKVDAEFFKTLPIFVFAFTCHQNIFSVHNELEDNSIPNVSRVIQLSIGTAFCVYQFIGITGYLTFGNTVSGNIISMYPAGTIITIGQLALAILFLLSYPLQCHPSRASLEKVLTNGNPTLEMTPFLFNLLTTLLLVGSYLISISVSDLSTVLSLVGATGSTTICYILPGLLYYKLRIVTDPVDAVGRWDFLKAGSVLLAAFGVIVMVFSVATQVAHLAETNTGELVKRGWRGH